MERNTLDAGGARAAVVQGVRQQRVHRARCASASFSCVMSSFLSRGLRPRVASDPKSRPEGRRSLRYSASAKPEGEDEIERGMRAASDRND